MTLWVLDTDHVSLFQRKHPLVSQKIRDINPESLAITVITVQEQMQGWLNLIQRASNSERLIQAYTGILEAVKFFNQINVLNFNQAAFICYRDFKAQKIRIGSQDLKIASIVLSINGILVTRNRRDFECVPGLNLADWTINIEQS